MTWKDRYLQAHEDNAKIQYPLGYASGHYSPPKIPDIRKSNGLTTAIINFIAWNQYRATRIAAMGRMIKHNTPTESGMMLTKAKYIPGPTRRGTADISATIKGRSVMLEVKVGRDRSSEAQLKEQAREQRAGGIYAFIHDMDEFFLLYDSIINNTIL